MKPVRGSSRTPNLKIVRKPGDKSSEPQEPKRDKVRIKPPQKTKGGPSSDKSGSKAREKWVTLKRPSIVMLENILDLSMLTCLNLNRRQKEETSKHLSILKERLVGACAGLRVPPGTQRNFEGSSGRLKEETRRSLEGKKTLGLLESDLDKLLAALKEVEEEKRSLEQRCSSLRQELEEDQAVEMLQLAERSVLHIPAPPVHQYTSTLQAQLSSLVPGTEAEGMARRLGDALRTTEPLQEARLLLATAGHYTDGLLSAGPSAT